MKQIREMALTFAAILLLISVFAMWADCGAMARASWPALDAQERRLAFHVAKVSVNEGALWNPPEVGLVWQVVEHRADTTGNRLRFLAKHSPRALGFLPCEKGPRANCHWARNLSRDLEVRPEGLDVAQDYWQLKLAPRWAVVLFAAEAMVAGVPYAKPCDSPPHSWGGRRAVDWAAAVQRGLIPIGCHGTLNEGWAKLRRRVLPGGFAL